MKDNLDRIDYLQEVLIKIAPGTIKGAYIQGGTLKVGGHGYSVTLLLDITDNPINDYEVFFVKHNIEYEFTPVPFPELFDNTGVVLTITENSSIWNEYNNPTPKDND